MFAGEISRYLEELASSSATPGGGAAAALAGAQGVALLSMVSELSKSKKNLSQFQQEHLELLTKFERIRHEFIALASEDIEAFNEVMRCYKLDRDTAERNKLIQQATLGAAEVALKTARLVDDLWGDIERLKTIGNPSVITDVACGYYQLCCCFESSLVNVKINLNSLDSGKDRDQIEKELGILIGQRPNTQFEI